MTLLQTTLYSDSLRMDVHVNIIFPQNCARTPEDKRQSLKPPYRVLYLLHGLSSNEDGWLRFTSLERYARDLDLVIVLPTTHRGWYINNAIGYPYSNFISVELPEIIQTMFPVSTKREDTYIAGASMGGFGALKAAFTYPEKYGYVASLSGVTDLVNVFAQGPDPESPFEHQMLFDEVSPAHTDNDIYYLVQQAIDNKIDLPKVYLTCGTEDSLIEQNRLFKDRFGDVLELSYHENPGEHGWDYWDPEIKKVLDWLPTI
ncbi:alpha/beta hydrolase [Aerococcus sp. Group 2]|uniref:alpha/beta hydrolase n=1 Tax=Aerococcus sp. Group 2 TaxID=2976811 RepID=UPI0018A78947|nr:alpha/beta hydrolase family protein [Aerococcus sp. Group 2]MCY3035420.1 esterase family protein [Aerococcus sp. Group 2]MCY3038842.1 esterase family protein [Aerococcus sp. Group 2]MCY3040997.1 esterase family protein [Aerococcus sp. Group 2]MCY3042235.1 esterase family protein [Aerococcus sp. Group 2]